MHILKDITIGLVMADSRFYVKYKPSKFWRLLVFGRRSEIIAIHYGLYLLRREKHFLDSYSQGHNANLLIKYSPSFVAPIHINYSRQHGKLEMVALQDIEFLRAEIISHPVNAKENK